MTNVLIELVEIGNSLESRYVIHVDKCFKAGNLQNYLNIIKNNEELYTFYIEKEIFKTTLEDVIEKHKINLETKIVIEFEIEKNKFDAEINFEKPISFIGVCKKNDCLVIGFYTDSLKMYKNNRLEDISGAFSDIRMYSSDASRQFGYSDKGLIDFQEESIELVENITSLLVSDGRLFYGLRNGKAYEFTNKTHNCLAEIDVDSIFTQGDFVYFASRNGDILKYFTNESKAYRKKYSITCAESTNSSIFFGTSSNMLYMERNGEDTGFPVEIRYIDFIRIISEDCIVISGQYLVQIINLNPYKLVTEFKFNTEVCGLEIYDNELIIGSGSRIYRKKLNL